MLKITPKIQQKLARPDHSVTEAEIIEAFANRPAAECIDNRPEHRTKSGLPSRWFVSETDRGRKLKVCYVQETDGDVYIKTAYTATAEVERVFWKYAS